MIIKSTFIGTNNSLGYITDKEYTLEVIEKKPGVLDALAFNLFIEAPIIIRRLDYTGWCPYESLDAFLNNWKSVSKVKTEERSTTDEI